MMLDIWLKWMDQKGFLKNIENEIGTQKDSSDLKQWKKSASKSSLYQRFVNQKIEAGEKASMQIGNMYTASVFMSFLSFLTVAKVNQKELVNNVVGFLSYGSGSKSKIFEGEIAKDWQSKISGLEVFKKLDQRKLIDFETYEKLHNGSLKKPISNHQNIVLDRIDDQENKVGFRHYKIN